MQFGIDCILWCNDNNVILPNISICVYMYAKQKHLGCKKGETNQKQQLSDYG